MEKQSTALGKQVLQEKGNTPEDRIEFEQKFEQITGKSLASFAIKANVRGPIEESVTYVVDNWTLYQDAHDQLWTLYDNGLPTEEQSINILLELATGVQSGIGMVRKDGISLSAWERVRQQTEEHYTVLGDLNNPKGAMALAGAAYAVYDSGKEDMSKVLYPFKPEAFKPLDRISNLKRAAALIMAEIDRELISGVLSQGFNGEGDKVSSQVNRIEYDPQARLMRVVFKSGTYEYSNVPVEVWADAYKAESIGKWVNANLVKGGYAFIKL